MPIDCCELRMIADAGAAGESASANVASCVRRIHECGTSGCVACSACFAARLRKHTTEHGTVPDEETTNMIKWAIIFAIIGLIAGALGFGGMAGAAMGIAKFLFWAGIIIAIVLFVLGMTIAKKVT
ncbi:uncharacterized membrane protein YtjA (UPF0391 family) [Xanthomonas arboricola]|nr:uncharacterized membrane protein YtjA (UPF0391 family) [Xanthomonas arboricola]